MFEKISLENSVSVCSLLHPSTGQLFPSQTACNKVGTLLNRVNNGDKSMYKRGGLDHGCNFGHHF